MASYWLSLCDLLGLSTLSPSPSCSTGTPLAATSCFGGVPGISTSPSAPLFLAPTSVLSPGSALGPSNRGPAKGGESCEGSVDRDTGPAAAASSAASLASSAAATLASSRPPMMLTRRRLSASTSSWRSALQACASRCLRALAEVGLLARACPPPPITVERASSPTSADMGRLPAPLLLLALAILGTAPVCWVLLRSAELFRGDGLLFAASRHSAKVGSGRRGRLRSTAGYVPSTMTCTLMGSKCASSTCSVSSRRSGMPAHTLRCTTSFCPACTSPDMGDTWMTDGRDSWRVLMA
mmetsp:Transcript_164/g.367  ORF Transcript_164/g.367 Transcript_164/m.367 type:complete len:296 (-) Transcript_164:1196-2083(-)